MAGPLAREKVLEIGFCGPTDQVLKTHLDLMMNVEMFLVHPLFQTCLEESLLKLAVVGFPGFVPGQVSFVAVGQGFARERVGTVKPLKLFHHKTAGCVPCSNLEQRVAEKQAGTHFLPCVFTYIVP